MSTELYTLIAVLANLALTIFKEVRRARCSLGWGCCSCATVTTAKSESRLSAQSPTSVAPPVPSEYKVPVNGPDIDKQAVAAAMEEDWQLSKRRG
jgi:hypothetical protein